MNWWVVIMLLMVMVLMLRIYSGLLCSSMARRPDFPPITRQLCWALTAIQVASVFSFLGRFSAHWQQKEQWEGRHFSGMFVTGQLFSLAVATGGILVVLWLVKKVFRSIGKTERLARVMITSSLVDVKASELGLTAREVEVLEAMAEGNLSDQRLAEVLNITPNTAATHVRNILRKAGLHNRRDLLHLYGAGIAESQV